MRSWIVVLISWLFLATSALAENRLALVIGNDGYKHITVLQKARADAKGYAGLLREKGYSVQEGYNLGFLDMQAAVAQFIERIRASRFSASGDVERKSHEIKTAIHGRVGAFR